MHIGMILLTWLIIAIVVISGLIASGILEVYVEIEDTRKHRDEDDDKDDE